MAQHLSKTNTGNCGLISCHFKPRGAGLQLWSPAEGKLSRSQWEMLAMKFQPIFIYAHWQVTTCILYVLEVIFYLHHNHRYKKIHALCCVFEYFSVQQVQETCVIFVMSPARGEQCFQLKIRLKYIHCKSEIIKKRFIFP